MKFRESYVPYHVLLKKHEEEQKLKAVVASKLAGTVKWFSLRSHYGFLARDDGKGDIFVHQMNIAKSRMHRVYLRSLAPNEKVEFDVVDGKRGLEAANVTGPDGTDVRGVYILQLRNPVGQSNSSNGNRRRRRTDTKGDAEGDEKKAAKDNADGKLATEGDGKAKSPQHRRRRRTDTKNNSESKDSTPPRRVYHKKRNGKKSGDGKPFGEIQSDEKKAPAIKSKDDEEKSAVRDVAREVQSTEKNATEAPAIKSKSDEEKSAAKDVPEVQGTEKKAAAAAAIKSKDDEEKSAAKDVVPEVQSTEKNATEAPAIKSKDDEEKSAAKDVPEVQGTEKNAAAAIKSKDDEEKSAAKDVVPEVQGTEKNATEAAAVESKDAEEKSAAKDVAPEVQSEV